MSQSASRANQSAIHRSPPGRSMKPCATDADPAERMGLQGLQNMVANVFQEDSKFLHRKSSAVTPPAPGILIHPRARQATVARVRISRISSVALGFQTKDLRKRTFVKNIEPSSPRFLSIAYCPAFALSIKDRHSSF
jgi:hypothetical protein